ncbi:MAG: Flp family type IVb pilin [Desulforudis sp.]|nr:MAG: Flp family type IVb pilin [Desulforudis sp.]
MLKKLWLDERGPTLLEYAGLAVLLLVGIWVAATQLAGGVGQRFNDIRDRVRP